MPEKLKSQFAKFDPVGLAKKAFLCACIGTMIPSAALAADTLTTPDGRTVGPGFLRSETRESFQRVDPYARAQENPYKRLTAAYSRQIDAIHKMQKSPALGGDINWQGLEVALQRIGQTPYDLRFPLVQEIAQEGNKLPTLTRRYVLSYIDSVTKISYGEAKEAESWFELTRPPISAVDQAWQQAVLNSLEQSVTVNVSGAINGDHVALPTWGGAINDTVSMDSVYLDAARLLAMKELGDSFKFSGNTSPMPAGQSFTTSPANLESLWKELHAPEQKDSATKPWGIFSYQAKMAAALEYGPPTPEKAAALLRAMTLDGQKVDYDLWKIGDEWKEYDFGRHSPKDGGTGRAVLAMYSKLQKERDAQIKAATQSPPPLER